MASVPQDVPRVWRPVSVERRICLVALLLSAVASVSVWLWVVQPADFEEIERWIQYSAWGKAESLIRQRLRWQPNEPESLLLLGRVLAAREQYAQGAQELERITAPSGLHAEGQFRAGQAWLRANFRRRAERCWLACLELTERDPDVAFFQQEARYALCELYAIERRRDEFLAISNECLSHETPDDRPRPLGMRVHYDLNTIDHKPAIQMLEPAVQHDAKDMHSRRAIGSYHLQGHELAPARALLAESVAALPDEPLSWSEWLECLDRSNDPKLADESKRLPQSIADKSAACQRILGRVAERAGRLDDAIGHFTRARELEPHRGEYAHQLGQLLILVGRKAEGQPLIELGQQLHTLMDKLEDAYRDFKISWRDDTTQRVRIAGEFAAIYEQQGRFADAAHWRRVLLHEDPTHRESIDAVQRLLAEP